MTLRFWDFEERLRELSAQGDPLEKLSATVDFEMFRPDLEAALGPRDPAKGGRPPFDAVLKFRVLVLHPGQHGLQHEAMVLARQAKCARVRQNCSKCACLASLAAGNRPISASESL